ncbi:MAG TPA: RNA polymerase sigma factor [Terriglobales bacterium]|nr:RNA polymerase sigma factor [Terriglobales bacterium]
MSSTTVQPRTGTETLTDEQVIQRVLSGETALYELIMRRYNQRLYRAVRSVLRNDDEVEDVMQDAYVRAYKHLADFAGRSQFSTWLIRIALHEAFARVRHSKRMQQFDDAAADGGPEMIAATTLDPEHRTANGELAGLLEEAILGLPENLRTVLMLRDVEELSTAETAEALELSEENVKTRLHRGRALVRRKLYARVGADAPSAFAFMGARCDRVVREVLEIVGNRETSRIRN